MTQRRVLLVGSIPCENCAGVFGILGQKLGNRASRYPDGETGGRLNWVRWQRHVFEDNPDLELRESARKIPGMQDNLARPFFALKDNVDLAKFAFKSLGYADEAIKSYKTFAQMKKKGEIPVDVKFQACMPTTASLISVFIEFEDRAKVAAAMEAAMAREVTQMAAAIPHDELAIQWDVVNEIVGMEGGMELYFAPVLETAVEHIARHIQFIPVDIEAGVHLCYGDPGHKHIVEPSDTAMSVAFANAICARASRPVSWVHMAIPRSWDKHAYYEPLAKLSVPAETQIYLGLLHATDGEEGAARRIEIASKFLPDFGVATECGFGRRDPATVPNLLEIHRFAAGT